MTVQFIRSEADVFPAAASARTAKRIKRVEVVLDTDERVELNYIAVQLMESLREGLAEDKVAHLEMDETLVPPERAAELLGVSRPTIYAWQNRGRIGQVDIGGKRMVPLADVEAIKSSVMHQLTAAARQRIDIDAPDEPLTDEDMQALKTIFQ
jgi:excisionase family DNA binding protein